MKLARLVAEIIWPRGVACLCCGNLNDGEFICSDCSAALEMMRVKPREQGKIRSAYRHDGVARDLVLMLKLDCAEDAAYVLAKKMAKEVKSMNLSPDTILTWVTMPEDRLRRRGIDHGRTLCEALSELCGMEMRQLLKRCGRFSTQRGLRREERLKNLNGTVVCTERVNVPVLLIDDVTTTGTTAAVCSQALLKAGAPRVDVLTATRATNISQEYIGREDDRNGLYTF